MKSLTFPSPFGVHVLKNVGDDGIVGAFAEFPSPFGVHVLKN